MKSRMNRKLKRRRLSSHEEGKHRDGRVRHWDRLLSGETSGVTERKENRWLVLPRRVSRCSLVIEIEVPACTPEGIERQLSASRWATHGAAIVKTILRNRARPRIVRSKEIDDANTSEFERSERFRVARIQVDNAERMRRDEWSRDLGDSELENEFEGEARDDDCTCSYSMPHRLHTSLNVFRRAGNLQGWSPRVTFSSRGKYRGRARADNRARMHTALGRWYASTGRLTLKVEG